ncbi:MAG: hypothetical protein V4568_14385 [Pseudomonadota bacterium]
MRFLKMAAVVCFFVLSCPALYASTVSFKDFPGIAVDDGYIKCAPGGGSCSVGSSANTAAIGRGMDGLDNRTILSFDTSALPNDALITRAYLTVRYSSSYGDPWRGGNNSLRINIKKGTFGTAATQTSDWSAVATVNNVATIPSFSSGIKISGNFSDVGKSAINTTGKTQLRLQFDALASAAYLFIKEGTATTLHVEYQTDPVSPSAFFEYYGWFYAQYGLSATPNDLALVAPYTNTGFAIVPEQLPILKPYGFRHNVYSFNEAVILEILYRGDNQVMPAPDNYGVIWHENYITDFRNKFFIAYRAYMVDLKNALIANGLYATVDTFYLADEPALRRNVYLDQAFLDRLAAEFKTVFPDKKSAITFAQHAGPAYPARGPHYNPPVTLDIVMVDPYFYVSGPGQPVVPCNTTAIRDWLYQGNAESNIGWAKQFGKPIVVIGDGRLQGGLPLPDCHIIETYNILKADPAVKGLVWWIYDKDYTEGPISGGGNSPHLVDLIRRLQ